MNKLFHIPESIKREIHQRLDEIEKKHEVKILHACESGSRAWGFASTDSDFDVRCIYAHYESWYLTIDVEKKRDVIELPIKDELDINGWDLRKTLQLLRKSNPALLEWLRSPVVYRENKKGVKQIRQLIPQYYSEKACYFHYFHMAKGNYKAYLKKDEIKLKKYFYVLRPVLALKWIEQKGEFAPIEFEKLVEELVTSADLKKAIQNLLKKKRSGKEIETGSRIEVIHSFLKNELERLEKVKPAQKPQTNTEALNRIFRKLISD